MTEQFERYIPVVGPRGHVPPRWAVFAPGGMCKTSADKRGLQLAGSDWTVATRARALTRAPNAKFTVTVHYETDGELQLLGLSDVTNVGEGRALGESTFAGAGEFQCSFVPGKEIAALAIRPVGATSTVLFGLNLAAGRQESQETEQIVTRQGRRLLLAAGSDDGGRHADRVPPLGGKTAGKEASAG